MATNADQRTMPASPARRLEARRRGEVAQSRLLRVAGQWLVVVVAFAWLGGQLIDSLASMLQSGLHHAATGMSDMPAEVASGAGSLVAPVIWTTWPLLVVVAVSGVLVTLVQTGWLWAPAVAVPRWERLHPGDGLARLVGGNSVMKWLLALGQLVLVVLLGGWFLAGRMEGLLADSWRSATDAREYLAWLLSEGLQLSGMLAVGLLALGLADWAMARWRYEQGLKMTPEEWRREQQENATPRRPGARVRATLQRPEQSVN